MAPEEQETITTQVFEDWAQTERAERMGTSHDELLHPLFEYWEFDEQSCVLDIGCGAGIALLRAYESGAGAVAGLDLSKRMIDRAIEKLPEGSDLRIGSVLSLPWKNELFTHVVSVEALYYIENPADAIKEIYRVLRNGGQFSMVIEFYENNAGAHNWQDKLPMKLTNWSEDQWSKAFIDAGFKDVHANRVIRAEVPDEASFEASGYFPSFDLYKEYLKQGALWVRGYKR